MYAASRTPRFERDVKACEKKHWDTAALKEAIRALMMSDEQELDCKYKDHALTGALQGKRALHVDSAPNPPKGQWVVMYELLDDEILFIRTGTHDIYKQ